VSTAFEGPVEPLDGVAYHRTCEHIALFYETLEEQVAAVVPFIRQGLERGERVMYVLEERSREELLDALRGGPVDIDRALASGQLSFHTLEETYLRGGYFDADEMVEFYRVAIEEATAEYPALRVTADMHWILEDETSIEEFLTYESRVNELFENEDSIALCHYDLEAIPPDILTDIVRTHPHLVYDTTVCHNFYYTPAEEFLGPDAAERELEQMLGTLIDRTRARAELKDTVAEFEESNERLKRFAYVASHDLQEPLRMVSSYLRLLENELADELDTDAVECIEYAVDGADRMREMVEGLLNYSRVDMHDGDFETVDCNEVLDAVLADLDLQIEESDATLEVAELPTVVGNANLLEPEYTDQIFEVFDRLHSDAEYQGTGIGLALCRKIIDHHEGEIWVDSDPGEGTIFYFTLPSAR
jgi:signal transduction histidine kinase